MKLNKEEENCRDCQLVRDMKVPICNYHQGIRARQSSKESEIQSLREDLKGHQRQVDLYFKECERLKQDEIKFIENWLSIFTKITDCSCCKAHEYKLRERLLELRKEKLD